MQFGGGAADHPSQALRFAHRRAELACAGLGPRLGVAVSENRMENKQMRVAIVGSREFGSDPALSMSAKQAWSFLRAIYAGLTKKYGAFQLVSGHARGVDRMAEYLATELGYEKNIFPAAWERKLPDGTVIVNKAAGYERNVTIVDNADIVVALMHPGSKGTRHTVHIAMDQRKTVHIFNILNGEKFTECPCDDDATHKRLKAERTYQLITIDGQDVTLEGDAQNCGCLRLPHFHRESDHGADDVAGLSDQEYAMIYERTCQTCGRETPEGECFECARETYGAVETDRYGITKNAGAEDDSSHPDVTGKNYYVVPSKEWKPNPYVRGTFRKLVNGYWMETVERVADESGTLIPQRIDAKRLAEVEQYLLALAPGTDTLPATKPFAGVKVAKEHKAPEPKKTFVAWTPGSNEKHEERPDVGAMMAANAAILAHKAATAFKGGATFQVLP